MPVHTALRFYARAIHSGHVKGLYHDSDIELPEECLGDWMEDELETLKDTLSIIAYDPFGATHEDYTAIAMSVVNLISKNKDSCQFEKIYDDVIGHCLEDKEYCFYGIGLEKNVVKHAVPLVTTFMDLWQLGHLDECATPAEKAEYAEHLWFDIGSEFSYLYGFDKEWDGQTDLPHVSLKEFVE